MNNNGQHSIIEKKIEGRAPRQEVVHKTYTVTDQLITRITGWVAGIIIILLVIWGWITLYNLIKYEDTNDAQVQEYINPLISRAGGFIVDIRFEENQIVKKGDTLLLIDNREYFIQQHQTEAALLNTKAQMIVLESNIKTLEKNAKVDKSKIIACEAKLLKEQLDYDRFKKLLEVESATQRQLEDIKANLDVASAEVEAAKENYEASLSKVNDAKAQVHVLNAEIKRQEALLERHKLDVTYTTITAPYDCRMGRRTIEKGQMIDAGQVLAYIVNNETDKWVVANYKETQIANMKIGKEVEFTADAYPSKKFHGEIISISPATGSSFSLLPPDNSSGNYVKIVQRVPVRIKVTGSQNEIALLKVGMNVNVRTPK